MNFLNNFKAPTMNPAESMNLYFDKNEACTASLGTWVCKGFDNHLTHTKRKVDVITKGETVIVMNFNEDGSVMADTTELSLKDLKKALDEGVDIAKICTLQETAYIASAPRMIAYIESF